MSSRSHCTVSSMMYGLSILLNIFWHKQFHHLLLKAHILKMILVHLKMLGEWFLVPKSATNSNSVSHIYGADINFETKGSNWIREDSVIAKHLSRWWYIQTDPDNRLADCLLLLERHNCLGNCLKVSIHLIVLLRWSHACCSLPVATWGRPPAWSWRFSNITTCFEEHVPDVMK